MTMIQNTLRPSGGEAGVVPDSVPAPRMPGRPARMRVRSSSDAPPARGFRAVAYGAPVLATVLATVTWVRPGTFVASGDVPPFEMENTAAELTSLWNHQIVGTGSTSYTIVQLLPVALVRAAGVVGLSPVVAQFLLYALIWSFATFGGSYLAAVWTRRATAVAVAGLVAAFNAYLLVNHPNPLPALAIGLTGTLVGMTLRAGAGRPVSVVGFAALTLPASYLAQNPPLLVVAGMAVLGAAAAASVLVGRGATRRALGLQMRAGLWALLLNVWWMVPYALTLSGMRGIALSANTDVAQWAWTHARASLDNVATLNSHWGWKYLQYYPFRPQMEAGGWSALRWALPALAAAGALLADRRRRPLAWILTGLSLVLIVLGTGLHPPFGGMNLWLYENVPGAWLLRDPAMKLSVVLALCYGVLAAIAVDRLLSIAVTLPGRLEMRLVVAVIVVAAVGYPSPLWTGAVVPSKRTPLPGSHVQIPREWYAAARAVNSAASSGKVLVLPLNSYYQVTTTWGYHGVDMIPAQLLARPVVQLLPGGYFRSAGSAEALIAGVQSALLAGDRDAALHGLRALGIGQVIVRHDLVGGDGAAPSANAKEVGHGTDAALVNVARFPIADVYRVPDAVDAVTAYRSVVTVVDNGAVEAQHSVPDVSADAVTTADPGVAGEVLWQPGGEDSFSLNAAGRYKLAPSSKLPIYRAEVVQRRKTTTLQLTDPVTVTVDGSDLPSRPPLDIPLDPKATAIAVNGTLRPLTGMSGLIQFSGQTTFTPYVPAKKGAPVVFGPVSDCARGDSTDPGITMATPAPATMRLTAKAHAACVSAPIPQQPDSDGYVLQFDYQQMSGPPARICLWQSRAQSCADLPKLADGKGWQTYRGVVRVAKDAGPLSLLLYADGGAAERTVIDYRDVRVDPLRAAGQTTIDPPQPPAVDRELAAGRHSVAIRQSVPPIQLSPSGPVGNCNATTGGSPAELGLRADHLPGDVLELTAAAGIACVQLTTAAVTGDQYRLRLDYRTLAGQPARICLWQVGPERCAALPALARSADWTSLSAVVRPEPGTRAIQLFLYADGQSAPPTVVDFRAVALTVDPGLALHVRPAVEPPPAPALSVKHLGLADFRVSVRGASGRFALVVYEAAAPGWRLAGLPPGWSAQRFTAYGYANGWMVTGRGDAEMRISYGPGRYADAARRVSQAVAILLLAWTAATALRRRLARRRRWPHRTPTRWSGGDVQLVSRVASQALYQVRRPDAGA